PVRRGFPSSSFHRTHLTGTNEGGLCVHGKIETRYRRYDNIHLYRIFFGNYAYTDRLKIHSMGER
ncbi:MAG: hypothetical protein M0R18_07545, partial [Deltaproteobacteria bacterium]|nr:hypothetical protein [Deltaproteobacteria bacterium]